MSNGHRPREISGFTLFWNGDKREGREPGWQMSVNRKGEPGWDVQRISEDQAKAIFALLISSGHPDGSWTVSAPVVAIHDSKYGDPWPEILARWKEVTAENTEARDGLA